VSGSEERKPSPQEDLLAVLSNPDAMRLLAFGARAMGRVVDTGREIGKAASAITPGPFIPSPAGPSSPTGSPTSTATADGAVESNSTTSPGPAAVVPDGSMLVPVEAWNRVLDQLGNIHEAGQALAEARERAARAEAVAEFQAERRRLAEAEAARLAAELEASQAPPPAPATATAPTPADASVVTRRRLFQGVSNWLRS
jgi:hypothetical protein